MQLLFAALFCCSSVGLLSANSAGNPRATFVAEARMSFRPGYEKAAYAPIQGRSEVVHADPTSLIKYYAAQRHSLSERGYCKSRSFDSSCVANATSSLLPDNFREDFSARWYCPERSVEYFKNEFDKKLKRLGIFNQHEKVTPYERAEIRRWGLYESWEFRKFLQSLCVYQDYILEIAAELSRDKQLAESVAQACDEALLHECAGATTDRLIVNYLEA